MALATYADLRASIANWLHRTDIDAIIPDWVAMAESRINRTLKLRVMEFEAVVPIGVGARTASVPVGFVEPIAMWSQTDATATREAMTFRQPQDLPVTNSGGMPSYWTVDADTVAVERPIDSAAYVLTMRYRKSFALSDLAPTNWLLTNHPDLYLYGGLLESAPFIKDDGRLPLWQNRFDLALQEVQNKEGWSKSLAPLVTDAAYAASRFDIYGG